MKGMVSSMKGMERNLGWVMESRGLGIGCGMAVNLFC